MPAGLSFTKISDQAVNIEESVDEFMLKFFVALGVVLIVSLISLGWRVGIVVAAAVPLTIAAVLVIMLVTDRVFDRVTLGALIISWTARRRRDHCHRNHGGETGRGHGPHQGGGLCMESYRRSDVVGHAGDHYRLHAGRVRSFGGGEYAGNIFWIVGFALITSWIVAVVFTPYLGVKLLPEIKPIQGGTMRSTRRRTTRNSAAL